ncbi:MAG: hypothetical protein N2039_07715 [Gemmataceae bacterium]|nr:hypothetical protein [Gemmataceae bacterium]
MIRRLAFALGVVWLAGTTWAADSDRASKLAASKSRARKEESPTVRVVVLQTGGDSPSVPGTVSAPIVISDNISDVSAGAVGSVGECDRGACSPGFLAKVCPKATRPKQPFDPLQCGTFKSGWRFAFGSCAAFFEEGRYEPKYPWNCPCGK